MALDSPVAARAIRRALAFLLSMIFAVGVLAYCHNRFWWPPDEGVYAHVAERMLGGEVLNRDIQNLHAGYINFAKDGLGDFQFGYVRCDIDWSETERGGEPAVDFTFEGMDEMDPCSGRGRATISGDTLDGMIYFHRGDESGLTAKKSRK